MTVSLLHTTPADGTFSAQGATAWDAEHTLTMATGKVLGRSTAGDGAVEELSELTLTSGIKTASAPVLNMTQTWNNAAVTFTGLKLNVTDTASNAASLLADLQVGGSSRFSVSKSGKITAGSGNAPTVLDMVSSSGIAGIAANGVVGMGMLASGSITHPNAVQWGLSASANSNASDTWISRAAAANIRLGRADAAAPVAQTLSVQSVVAGTTNTAGANLTITGSAGTGTGAGGSIVFQVAPAGLTGTAQNSLVTFLEATSARAFNLYNTTDVTTNYERGFIKWATNVLRIGTEKGGTGTARALELQTDGTSRWSIGATTGHLLAGADNTYDIGASGARPRNVYAATSIDVTGSAVGGFLGLYSRNTSAGSTASSGYTGQNDTTAYLYTRIYSSAVTGTTVWGVTLANYSAVFSDGASSNGLMLGTLTADPIIFGTDTTEKMRITSGGLVTFGGTTSSFPALKRSTTVLQARLADDSAYATIQGKLRADVNAVAETPTATHTITITDAAGTAYKVLCVAA